MRAFLLCTVLLMGCSPSHVNVDPTVISTDANAAVERAGRLASGWSLKQLNKLNHAVASGAAKALKGACASGVEFLENEGTQQTAEAVNRYLVDYILKNINPAVAAAIDVAAGVLDDILQVPAGTTLTKAELKLLASFVRGLGNGCEDFLLNRAIQAPILHKSLKNSRKWLRLATPRVSFKVQRDPASEVGGTVPPDEVLGITCLDGIAGGYSQFSFLLTTKFY